MLVGFWVCLLTPKTFNVFAALKRMHGRSKEGRKSAERSTPALVPDGEPCAYRSANFGSETLLVEDVVALLVEAAASSFGVIEMT